MLRSFPRLKDLTDRLSKSKFHTDAASLRRVKTSKIPTQMAPVIATQTAPRLQIIPEKRPFEFPIPEKRPFDVRAHIPSNTIVKHNSINIDRGLGMWLFDKSGNQYLDMTSGIGVLGTGHSHPRIITAVSNQLQNLVHAQQTMVFSHSKQDEFIEHFLKYTPGGGKMPGSNVAKHDQFVFCSSGGESTENAIKVAKMHTKRSNVIALQGGFHGRTLGTMAISSSKISYRQGFMNPMAGNFFCPEPTAEAFDLLLATQTAPNETACVILEPIQGEGGVRQVPKEFLKHVRAKCDEHGILLIFDEVRQAAISPG